MYFLFSIFDVDEQTKKDRFNYNYIYRIVRIQIRRWRKFWLLFFNFSFSIAFNFQHSFRVKKRFYAKKCFCNNNDIDIRIVLFENDRFIAVIVFRIKFVFWIRLVWIIDSQSKMKNRFWNEIKLCIEILS